MKFLRLQPQFLRRDHWFLVLNLVHPMVYNHVQPMVHDLVQISRQRGMELVSLIGYSSMDHEDQPLHFLGQFVSQIQVLQVSSYSEPKRDLLSWLKLYSAHLGIQVSLRLIHFQVHQLPPLRD